MSIDANSEQVRYWSEDAGPRWVSVQEQTDAQLRGFGVRALDALGLAPGQSVVDVGAGCGDLSLEIARRVGPSGRVQAVDIAPAMLERARERALGEHLENIGFQIADVQVAALDGAPFDAAASRFGVMFFDDPPAAFRRLRASLRPGGRLAFCCWRSREENAWLSGPSRIASQFVDLPVSPDPHAPGPFGLFDAERTRGILESAGWSDIRIEPFDADMTLGGATSVEGAVDFLVRLGPIGAAMGQLDAPARARLLDAVRAFLAPHLRPEGVVLPGATWIVTARSAGAA